MADYKRVGPEVPLEQLSNGTGLRVGRDVPHKVSVSRGPTTHYVRKRGGVRGIRDFKATVARRAHA